MLKPLLFQEPLLLVPPCKILVDQLVNDSSFKHFYLRVEWIFDYISNIGKDLGIKREKYTKTGFLMVSVSIRS